MTVTGVSLLFLNLTTYLYLYFILSCTFKCKKWLTNNYSCKTQTKIQTSFAMCADKLYSMIDDKLCSMLKKMYVNPSKLGIKGVKNKF